MENKSQSDVKELFKKNMLSQKAVTTLLVCMILVLVGYIVGTQFAQHIKHNPEDIELSDDVSSEPSSTTGEARVNINTDDMFELCSVPGIGEAKARSIIEYRKENGDITDLKELLEIKGIGEKLLDNISQFVYIE